MRKPKHPFNAAWGAVSLLLVAAISVFLFPGGKASMSRIAAKWRGQDSEPRAAAVSSEKPGPAAPVFDPAALDGRRALAETADIVAIGPRVSGTEGAEKAARHIAARLNEIGLEPQTDEFVEDTVEGKTTFRNVVATIPGDSGDIVVVLSHYDTRAGIGESFVGANDSGSSSGLLLEIARALRSGKRAPVGALLAFLDGEECRKKYDANDGLHGSCRLASRLTEEGRRSRVKAVILLDMVGDRNLTVTIPLNSAPSLASLALAAAREEGARDKFSLFQGSILDDHVPFMKARMPAVDIIDFEYGSVPGKNDYWHTEEDTMDKLSAESLETVGRVVIRMLNKLM